MIVGNNLKKQSTYNAEFFLRLFAPVAWSAVILWLSLIPSPPQIPGILGWDKLLHAGAYALLTVLIVQFLFCLPGIVNKAWWFGGVLAVCYGALIELLQMVSQTGRHAEWWDLVADAVGVFISSVIFRQLINVSWLQREPLDEDHG